METKKGSIDDKGKKWLISIVVGIFILSVPVLFVAWGMTWKWTSFAPGKTDGWIGFWGGYLGAIMGALAAGVIAYFVARQQIRLEAKETNKREKEFLAMQFRIEKHQEAYSLLSESNREFAIAQELVEDYCERKIDLKELSRKITDNENNILGLRRKLQGLTPFVEGLEANIDEMTKLHKQMIDVIINTYVNYKPTAYEWKDDNGETLIIPPSYRQPGPEASKEVVENLMDYTAALCLNINKYLKQEIELLIRED
ncbi:hypothetical protein [Priestia megaterium]